MNPLLILFIASISFADELNTRRVVNGTILYSARASSKTEIEASFLAQAGAIKQLLVECRIAHREIKLFKNELVPFADGFSAFAEAGISFEDCGEAKHASGEKELRLTNKVIVADQAIYDKVVRQRLGVDDEGFELRAYLETHFLRTNRKIEAISNRIERLEPAGKSSVDRPDEKQSIVIVQQVPAVASVTSCQQEYVGLMQAAQVESRSNFPPGNLAQGKAADYLNRAMQALGRCR